MLCQAVGSLAQPSLPFCAEPQGQPEVRVRAFPGLPCMETQFCMFTLPSGFLGIGQSCAQPLRTSHSPVSPCRLLVAFSFVPAVITTSGNFEAKQLLLVVLYKYSVEKAVHRQRTLRPDEDKPCEGVSPLVDSPGTCQAGQMMAFLGAELWGMHRCSGWSGHGHHDFEAVGFETLQGVWERERDTQQCKMSQSLIFLFRFSKFS